jgi:hypothetical protein
VKLKRVLIEMLFVGKMCAATRLTTLIRRHELRKRDVGWASDRTRASGRENPEISAA